MKRLLISILAIGTVFVSSLAIYSPTAGAVTASDWKAGRIIDDAVFTNPDEMSVADIQNFLNTQVPVCDTNGTQPASEYGRPDLTRAQYAASRGWAGPPYVCLRDYYEVPKTSPGNYIPANNFSGSIPPGAVSAAQLIYNAAKVNNINPKVILIKIATESAGPLTSDKWPLQNQYTYAMGANCPDSGPNGSANCDRNYAGLSIQLSQGAGLLRWYLNSMDQSWWAYKKPFQTNSIMWNVVERGCGAGNVYIESKATAALYTYTPYQPNQAALNNMYGLGDHCSAYGNRNFWRVWHDLFGSPNAPDYAWQAVDQAAYTDQTKSTKIGWHAKSLTGQKVYVQVKAKNTGNATWSNSGPNTMLLGTWNVQDRSSRFCNNSWITCNRAAKLVEPTVAPGEIGTFEFWMQSPSTAGSYQEYFNLVAEGKTWLNATGMYIGYTVERETYQWQPAGQSMYWDETKTVHMGWNASTTPGQRFYAVVRAKNTGNVTWTKSTGNPIRIATWNPQDRKSSAYDASWLASNRIAMFQEESVPPGGTATFEFWMQTPNKTGDFNEYLNLVAEGKTWLNATGMHIGISSKHAVYQWQPVGQSVWTDSTKAVHLGWNGRMAPGGRNYVEIYAKNTGNTPWVKDSSNPTLIGTWNVQDRSSPFLDTSWIARNRMAVQQQPIVYPGQTAVYQFYVTAPATPGQYSEYFNIVAESRTWLNPTGQFFIFTVQ